MTPGTAEIVIKDFLKEVRRRLDEAASVARAAEVVLRPANPEVATSTSSFYEANTLLNGATVLNRRSKEKSRD